MNFCVLFWAMINYKRFKKTTMINQKMNEKQRLLTVEEVAEYLQLDKHTIYRMARRGEIPAIKIAGKWRFKKEKIDEWLLNMENTIENVINKGLAFIEKHQLSSGEIPTLRADNINMQNAVYVKTVTITFLVIWALQYLKNFPKAKSIIQRGIDFLLSEKENGMVWKFFGKGSEITPDLDDTASILAVLKENNISIDYEKYAKKLIKIRNENGLFYTWFPEKGKGNNVDWVVNANVLYFFQTMGIRIPEVEGYLVEVAKKGLFKKGSLYYHSPYAFGYFVSKLYYEFNLLEATRTPLIEFVIDNYKTLNCIDLALGAVTLLNFGFKGKELDLMIKKILNTQMSDGGWGVGTIFKHRTKEIYYGSRELTTGVALESLNLYKKWRLSNEETE